MAEVSAASRTRMRRRVLIIGVAAALVLLAGATIGVTSSPSFCAKCHTIAPSVDGWAASAHAEVGCTACHAAPGVWGFLSAKFGRVGDLRAYLTSKPENWQLRGSVPSDRCVACHAESWDDPIFALDHPAQHAPCDVCHRDTAHTNYKPVYPEFTVAARDVSYGDEVTCAECHTDRRLLREDLAANPMPEKVESASQGEG